MSKTIHFSKQEALAIISNLFQYESTSACFGLDSPTPDFDLSDLMTVSPVTIVKKYIYCDGQDHPAEIEDFKSIVKSGSLALADQCLDYVYRNIEENLFALQANYSGLAPDQWVDTVNGLQANYSESIRVLNPFFKQYLPEYDDLNEIIAV
jgi:hypothetical protein